MVVGAAGTGVGGVTVGGGVEPSEITMISAWDNSKTVSWDAGGARRGDGMRNKQRDAVCLCVSVLVFYVFSRGVFV